MINRISAKLLALLGLLLAATVSPDTASALGSDLRAPHNTGWGCNLALILDPISGVPVLAQTGQTSCTMRTIGYINSLQIGSYVPSNGFVTRVRIKSGNAPVAPVRVTIMTGSPGLCCSGKSMSRVLRPRPNRITQFTVNMRVVRSVSVGNQGVQNVNDVVGLSAVGPGSLPLSYQGTSGTFTSGTALTQFWFPLTQRNQVRVADAYTIDGIELLMRWDFQRTNPAVLR